MLREQNSAIVLHYLSVLTNYVDRRSSGVSSPLNHKQLSESWQRHFITAKKFDI